MRFLFFRSFTFAVCLTWTALATAQSTEPDNVRLTKIRASYDAPFLRNLGSFDCAVQFDWSHHLTFLLGAVPPAVKPATDRLQTIQKRVFVDRSGASVSQIPKAADLTALPVADKLEQALESIVSAGINNWLPYATNVILPVGPTQYHFEADGSKLSMTAPGVSAILSLLPDGRLASGISDKPQPLHFTTEFIPGPQGFLLSATQSGPDSLESSFAYRYEAVDGFQLPTHITVHSLVGDAAKEVWEIELTDCKVNRSVTLEVGPPQDSSPSRSEIKQTLPQ